MLRSVASGSGSARVVPIDHSPPSRVSGLPLPRSSLVGREQELAAGRNLILEDAAPLLTMTGPGGVGKTRLAIELAQVIAPHFADGVVGVDLSPVSDPAMAPSSVAAALAVTSRAERCQPEAIIARVRNKQLLVVLDNCEHLLEAVADLACTLLAACPALQILATSRAPLRVRGEHILAVPPLTPPPPEKTGLDEVERNPAVKLFVQRARAADPGFTLTAMNAAAVAEICWRLDGLPLAVELAAARVKVLTPSPLLDLLRRRLHVLGPGPRGYPARQRSLHDAMTWSYDLLPPDARAWFRRLTVFAGGFGLDAAAAVNGLSESEIVEPLELLLDQSLVVRQRDGPDGHIRFSMLEIIRDFGLQQLALAGEEDATREAHAAYYLQLLSQLDRLHALPGDRAWLERVAPEQDNLRAALEWLAAREQGAALNHLSSSLFKFWLPRAELSEGRRWLTRAMACESGVSPSIRSRVRSAAGFLALLQGDNDAAMPLLDAGLALAREAAEPLRIAQALLVRGVLASRLGELDLATTLTEEAERQARVAGETESAGPLLAGIALGNLGYLALLQGATPLAMKRLEEAVRQQRAPGGAWGLSIALCDLGIARVQSGETREPAAHLLEALALAWSMQNAIHAARALRGMAMVAISIGQPIRAAQLLGAADATDDRIGAIRYGRDRNIVNWCLHRLGESLAPTALTSLRRSGASLTLQQGVAIAWAVARAALGDSDVAAIWQATGAPPLSLDEEQRASLMAMPSGSPGAGIDYIGLPPLEHDLTQRERQVLVLICQHLTDVEIGEQLFISRRTASTHVTHILSKLNAGNRRRAAAMAVQFGLV